MYKLVTIVTQVAKRMMLNYINLFCVPDDLEMF